MYLETVSLKIGRWGLLNYGPRLSVRGELIAVVLGGMLYYSTMDEDVHKNSAPAGVVEAPLLNSPKPNMSSDLSMGPQPQNAVEPRVL